MSDDLSRPAVGHEDFGILLGLAYQHFVEALRADLHERGFTDLGASFGYVLRALAAEPLTATQLAARLHLTPQGAAKIADAMVRHGYVERRMDPATRAPDDWFSPRAASRPCARRAPSTRRSNATSPERTARTARRPCARHSKR